MDKYMKFVLTIIAVGIIGINFQLFSGDIISKAEARHSKYPDVPYDPDSWTTRNHIWIDNWPSCK
jgi:hypothetical protein